MDLACAWLSLERLLNRSCGGLLYDGCTYTKNVNNSMRRRLPVDFSLQRHSGTIPVRSIGLDNTGFPESRNSFGSLQPLLGNNL